MPEEIKGVQEFLKYCKNFEEAIKNVSNFENECKKGIDKKINQKENKAEDISNYEKGDFFRDFKSGLEEVFKKCFDVPLKKKGNSSTREVLEAIEEEIKNSKKIENLKEAFDFDKYIERPKRDIKSRICDERVKKEFESFKNKVEELFEEYEGILEKAKKSVAVAAAAKAEQIIEEIKKLVKKADDPDVYLSNQAEFVEKQSQDLKKLVNELDKSGSKEKSIIKIIDNAKEVIGAKIGDELYSLYKLVDGVVDKEEKMLKSIEEVSEKIEKRKVKGLGNEIGEIEKKLKELKNDEENLEKSLKITVLSEEITLKK